MKRIIVHLAVRPRRLGLPFPVFALGCMPWAPVRPTTNVHPTVDFCFVLAADPAWWQGACDGVAYRVQTPYLKVHIPGKTYDVLTAGMAEGIYFAYDRALLPAFQRVLPGMETPCRPMVVTPLMEMLFKQVEQLAQESHLPGVADRLDSCAFQLIVETFAAAADGSLNSPELVVRKIASWFEVHFMEPDCAQWRALPRKHGISYRSFLRHWHRIYDRAPAQFIGDLRMRAGRHLLETTDKSVKEIARAVGLDDQYYFSRMFKSNLGFSPAAWRARHGSANHTKPAS